MTVRLFYLINPAYSNSIQFRYSGEISVLFVKFLTCLLHIVSQAKQSKQLLIQRNSSIIGIFKKIDKTALINLFELSD